MDTSSFFDFSNELSGNTLSLFDLNKKNQDHSIIAEKRGLSSERLAIPEQIHSAEITCVDTPGNYLGTDGLITDNPDIILIIKVADCVPIYLFESKSQIIGLVHSGWRGTVKGIIINTVNKMLEMGANKNAINIFMGPSIGFCCYKVERDVADKFDIKSKEKLKNGKWKVGLYEQLYIMLIKLGIPSNNIRVSNICTFESLDYHSYRRDRSQSGRMVALMRLKS